MLRNRRLTGWWLGLLVAVIALTVIAPLKGETASVVPACGEMKLLLQPDYFTDRNEGYIKFWTTVKVLAMEMGIPVTEAKNPYKEGSRKIVYMDTKARDLSKMHYIIRERVKVKDGNPEGLVDLTLRFRTSGVDAVPSAAVGAASGIKASISYDDDVAGFVGGIAGNNVSEMSASCSIKKIPSADLRGRSLGDYARYFPGLLKLGVPLDAPLTAVNGKIVREFKVSPGEFDFGQGIIGEASISLWFDYNTGKAIAAEFSFDSARGPKAPAAAVTKAEAFFNKIQERMGSVLAPGQMKTQMVTGN
ncbi:hypothetical protein [Anaeroselena agilis]|uniref:Uncharacterized protein n=1 Tax=Anaeroselena agilis TaxID=3063788 RepID=A0ABU3NSP2_9FIRM|nr:hypothetical protein [Selenomonadales bacterium 4137-cl]